MEFFDAPQPSLIANIQKENWGLSGSSLDPLNLHVLMLPATTACRSKAEVPGEVPNAREKGLEGGDKENTNPW